MRDAGIRDRIRSLAIPPAWTDVWISPLEHGHIQATGRDAKGRKQYRYHPRWRIERDTNKYHRVVEFGAVLPRVRAAVERDLALRGLPREKVIATLLRLLELTSIRVGNEEYARENRSFGLTTMRNRHVVVDGTDIQFDFRGKSGKVHSIHLRDRRLARILQRCEELPGQRLFEFVDDQGATHAIESSDVNDYLREVSGGDFTAKDYRTLAGTLLAARALREHPPASSAAETKRLVNEAIRLVASRLGNTPTVCRKCYIHPIVIDSFERGALGARIGDLDGEEAALMKLVRREVVVEIDVSVTVH